MPDPANSPNSGARKLIATLSEKERLEFGRELLGIRDGPHRQEVLADLAKELSHAASSVDDVRTMELPSQFKKKAQLLASVAKKFELQLRASDKDVRSLMRYWNYADVEVLLEQLEGIERFVRWLEEQPSKRGGERPAHGRMRMELWTKILAEWFDRHQKHDTDEARERNKKLFLPRVRKIVERIVKEANEERSNNRQN